MFVAPMQVCYCLDYENAEISMMKMLVMVAVVLCDVTILHALSDTCSHLCE